MLDKDFDLESLLSPYTREVFFQEHLGEKLLVVPGCQGRFSGLLTWTALNDILNHQQLDGSRLRVLKDGVAIPPGTFTQPSDGSGYRRLVSPTLTAYLRGGAMLVIDAIDDLYQPITRLAVRLERDLRTKVTVTLNAGFGQPRFQPRWETHHVIKMQIAGRTRWRVEGPAHDFPPHARTPRTMTVPQDGPEWEGALTNGDLLYVPRGWWYSGVPCGEPSLDLSLNFSIPTGSNILQWIADSLKERAWIRRDVPCFRPEELQSDYVRALQEAVTETVCRTDILTRFLTHVNQQAQTRPAFNLPSGATRSIVPESDGSIDLLVPRGLHFQPVQGENALDLYVNGEAIRFDASAEPLLAFLQESQTSISHFMALFESIYDAEILKDFLATLIDHGVIAIGNKT